MPSSTPSEAGTVAGLSEHVKWAWACNPYWEIIGKIWIFTKWKGKAISAQALIKLGLWLSSAKSFTKTYYFYFHFPVQSSSNKWLSPQRQCLVMFPYVIIVSTLHGQHWTLPSALEIMLQPATHSGRWHFWHFLWLVRAVSYTHLTLPTILLV